MTLFNFFHAKHVFFFFTNVQLSPPIISYFSAFPAPRQTSHTPLVKAATFLPIFEVV